MSDQLLHPRPTDRAPLPADFPAGSVHNPRIGGSAMSLQTVVNRIQREGGSVVVLPSDVGLGTFTLRLTRSNSDGSEQEALRFVNHAELVPAKIATVWKKMKGQKGAPAA